MRAPSLLDHQREVPLAGSNFRTMRQGIFKSTFSAYCVGTYLYAEMRIKSSGLQSRTASTAHVLTVDVAAKLIDLLPHEAYNWTCNSRHFSLRPLT